MAVPSEALPRWSDGAITRRVFSADHKRIGALYLLLAGLFLVGAGIDRLLWFLDTAHVPGGLLSDFGATQVFSLQATMLVFAFALPLTLGLGCYLVPLQIGARGLAWDRLNASAFWFYLCGISLMLCGFGAGDPSGDSEATPLSPLGQQLWLLGLLIVSVAAVVASLAILETVRTRRAPGMTRARLPLFTLASAGYAVVLVIGMTIGGIGALVFLADDGSARDFFTYDAGDGFAFYQRPAWFAGHVLTYAVFVPAVAMVSEALAARRARSVRARSLTLAAVGLGTGLAALVGLYHLLANPFGDTFANGVPLAGFVLLGAVAPAALAWLIQLAPLRPPPDPIAVLALGSIALLGLGTILGFALGFPGDYKAGSGSFNLIAHFDGVLASSALLMLGAGVLHWFPKLTGRAFDLRFARAASGLLVAGSLCVAIGQHIAGQGDLAAWSSGAKAGSLVALAGYLLVFLGGAQFVAGAVLSWRWGIRIGNDPGHADTLEWYTASPPPAHNFDRVPPVESDRPLHDLRLRLGDGTAR